MSKVLITGGGGFIGSHIVDAMLNLGHEVAVYDNWSAGRKENIAHLEGHIQVFDEDVRDPEALKKACKGVNVVYHEAALGSVPRSIANPAATNEVNVSGTLNTLIAARDAGVERFIYASSSSIYGDTIELPKHEGMPFSPRSPYALSKVTAEEYVRIFHDIYGISSLTLRYFNVFGPRQDPNATYAAVIPLFLSAMLEDRPFYINGDGLTTRDFTYIENVVLANVKCLTAPPEAMGQSYNIGAGGRYSLLDLVEQLNRATGLSKQPEFRSEREGDIRDSYASIDKAAKFLGYHPCVSFPEGIDKTVAAYMKSYEGKMSVGPV